MKKIFCPIDFSATSDAALKYAAGLAQHFNAMLYVLHIYELPVVYGDAPFFAIQQMGDEVHSAAEQNLKEVTSNLTREFPGLKIESSLITGIPAAQVLAEAKNENADLIVMGTKGRSAVERLLIGSTAERVFHHAEIPVLCVPANTIYNGIKRLVFATDLKEDNLNSAAAITNFAKSFNAEIQFVYVDTVHDATHEAKMAELTEKIRSHINYPVISAFVAEDLSVSHGIQEYLLKFPADVLVMFTHQRHFPRSLTQSSVTSKTLYHLEVPLLVLPQGTT